MVKSVSKVLLGIRKVYVFILPFCFTLAQASPPSGDGCKPLLLDTMQTQVDSVFQNGSKGQRYMDLVRVFESLRMEKLSVSELSKELEAAMSQIQAHESEFTSSEYLTLMKFIAIVDPDVFQSGIRTTSKVGAVFSANQQMSWSEILVRQIGSVPYIRTTSKLDAAQVVSLYEIAARLNPRRIASSLDSIFRLTNDRVNWGNVDTILAEAASSDALAVASIIGPHLNFLETDQVLNIALESANQNLEMTMGPQSPFKIRSIDQIKKILMAGAGQNSEFAIRYAYNLLEFKKISRDDFFEIFERATQQETASGQIFVAAFAAKLKSSKIWGKLNEILAANIRSASGSEPRIKVKAKVVETVLSFDLQTKLERAKTREEVLAVCKTLPVLNKEDLSYLTDVSGGPYDLTTLQSIVASIVKLKMAGLDYVFVDAKGRVDRDRLHSGITGINFSMIRLNDIELQSYYEILDLALLVQDGAVKPYFGGFEIPDFYYKNPDRLLAVISSISDVISVALSREFKTMPNQTTSAKQDAYNKAYQASLDLFERL